MARGNSTLPIRFFKIIIQTNLQRIKIPNKFTRKHGVGLSNPVLIKPPDGTKWKVYWKKINGEIWFEKGWNSFTQNYSLVHGCLVVFEYKEGTSSFDVVILGQNAVEIEYDSSCDTDDENDNLDHNDSDDESIEISDEWLNRKKARPLVSPRPHKKARGDNEKTTKRNSSMNWLKDARAQEVAENFISCNPFFTVLIKPYNLLEHQLSIPDLKGVIENKDKNVMMQLGKRSWNVKLLRRYEGKHVRRLSAGWSLFASESGLKSGNVCVFELINKKDLIFKVHIF